VDLLRSLRGSLILVVEDDPLIALDLTATLERAGVVVLGPAGRLNDAMLLAEKALPVAAVLDVRLEVGTTLPLAKWLADRDVSLLFQTSDPTHRCRIFGRSCAAQSVPARAADRSASSSSGQGTLNG
jgi:DNA-binding response OmpR family regulator